MHKTLFNDKWEFIKRESKNVASILRADENKSIIVNLPYDAMIHEERDATCKNGSQTGFYPGGNYVYTKKFDGCECWKGKEVSIQFDGIYGESRVFINGVFVKSNLNGYKSFFVKLNDYIKYGQSNEIKVEVFNDKEPNSRWYSGSGIYKSVYLIVDELVRIDNRSLKITTLNCDEKGASLSIDFDVVNDTNTPKAVEISVDILDKDKKVVANRINKTMVYSLSKEKGNIRLYIDKANLWDVDNPYLYIANIRLNAEECLTEYSQTFGIRTITVDPKNGFRLNGKNVKLRGACIHHDNGIIGANILYRAEERKVEILKKAGFNCARSSHNPISREFMEASDKLGFLIIDELGDMWNNPKNDNDYSRYFADNWEQDVEEMVEKDYNHPSIIMYSTGNEIPEAGTLQGARLNRLISNKFHQLDNSRFTTNSMSAFLALGSEIGNVIRGVVGKLMKNSNMGGAEKKGDSQGSNAMNSMMSIMYGPVADAFACDEEVTNRLEAFADSADVAGYNYLTARHKLENTLYPQRVILGSEEYAMDIPRLWSIVKENNHVIGDMTWTGWDYLGEAGIGQFYYDDKMPMRNNWPDRVSGCGDIDINGNRKCVSYYREIVFGLREAPFIAVERVNYAESVANKSTWAWKDALHSWTWNGCEGKKATVYVLSQGEEVELFKDGVSLGRKKVGEEEPFLAKYEVEYQKGILLATSYVNGVETGRDEILTANNNLKVVAKVDRSELISDGQDIAYIDISLVDSNGILNTSECVKISVEVEGCGKLIGLGNGQYSSEAKYDEKECTTYDGKALAIIRAGKDAGEIVVKINSENMDEYVVKLHTK